MLFVEGVNCVKAFAGFTVLGPNLPYDNKLL